MFDEENNDDLSFEPESKHWINNNFSEMEFKPVAKELPPEIINLATAINPLGFIAGGALRNVIEGEPIRDIDIFLYENDEQYEWGVKQTLFGLGYTELFTNPLVTRFQGGGADFELVDLIKPREDRYMKTFGAVKTVLSRFDFSVCRAAVFKLGEPSPVLLADTKFEDDIKYKTLRIQNIVCPISTVKRIGKYATYGYSIGAGQIVKLFVEWSNRPPEDNLRLIDLLYKSSNTDEDLTDDELGELRQILYID